jgi:hypothetical protein
LSITSCPLILHGCAENDYEVIPRVRAVIALDDAQELHELDPDETWEYVSSVGEDEPKAILSYAEIVAKSTHDI